MQRNETKTFQDIRECSYDKLIGAGMKHKKDRKQEIVSMRTDVLNIVTPFRLLHQSAVSVSLKWYPFF